ncbi:hypothetical protein CBR_g20164 [Chara braunii]|uniref:Reverse transcriptase n=1 Tax=Chara braunii TaxID=69332 RepID=A0A388KZP7_CHABU|nr:hypothetical protein CBR_g20164 [Chara braunii]|eukprot:GBG75534.1 hypothetical protein CBR_g20164 [Chara braunii]
MASSPSRIDRPLPFTRVIFSLAVVFIVVLLTSASRPCGAQPGANTQDGPIGPPEALYIDCGSNKSSNDSQGRNWLSDKPFMNGFKTALPADVRPSDTLSVDIPEAIVKTTRFFDDLGDTMPGDHCSIPVADNEAYWIRFTFPFYSSRQQGSNSDSVFDVWLYQAVRIATVNYSESGRGELPFGTYDILSLEIGLIPPSVQLNFSFVKRSGEGVHVSSIEILKLVNPESSGMFSNNFLPLRLPGPTVLRLEQRINCGGPHVNGSLALPYAYDEDRFYNISEKSIAVIGNITDNRASRVSAPSDILKSQRMAAEGANLTYSIPVTSGVKFVINAFWYELNKTLEKSGRQFKIFVDNFDATLEKDGKGREGVTTNDVFGTDLYSGGDGGRILIQLVPMPDQGNLPPIISGLEVYSLINLAGRTFPQDGDKKDETLDTWLRMVPVWVRAKRTSVEEEVITAASYLEGSAAHWLNGLVASKGFGRNMHDWAQTHPLESFMDLVEACWHNPQQAHIATNGLLKLDTRKYKSVRELTTAIERLIVVPGVEYNPQVLLTMFLRCLPIDIRNLLASDARREYHTFESFSKKALDLEATVGGAQTPSTDGRKKKTPQEWKKKDSRLMMVDSDGNQTKINDVFDLVEGSEFDGEESAEGSNLAARLSRPVTSTLANKECMMVEDYVKDVVCTFSYPGGEINHKISFLVSDELPFDMLLGMYYLEVAKPQFDWDKKVLKHELPSGRTMRLAKYKASRLVDSYGCLCASAFYNYYKQNQEEGMYLVYVSAKGEAVKTPPEIETIVAKYPDLFEEPTGVVNREVVHAIEIIPGSKTPKGRIYRMAPTELDELRWQLKELTEKGWIRPSTSPFGSPVLFVPKKGGTLRMCIDYRGLNAITVKNAKPLPRIDDLLDSVQECKYYTKIDFKSGCHQIAIRPEDQHKTAFHTSYDLYEFVVMPFGQHAMNRIFRDYLDKLVVVYLDDILIFSRYVEEHAQHVDTVLSLLRQHKYKINSEKCEFGRTRILYLGHEVFADGIRPEDAKVASIRDWPRPQSVTEVRSFLGMCGYYRNFVKNYCTITSPLTDLTRLDTPWDWTDKCEAAFKRLKHVVTHHEVLMVPDPQRPFVVTTDASQYGIGTVLAQQEGKKLRLIEYMSKKMPSKKLAKSTYERELYALYKALVHWRHYLLGRFFYLRTDHQTLKWIKTQPVLSDALKRWIKVIDQYDFKLDYLKGEYNKVADALSRRANYLDALISEFGLFEDMTRSLDEAYKEDPITMDIINKLQAKDKATTDEFVMVDGLLFLEKTGFKRLVVPSTLCSLFLGECYDAMGHFGYKKTSANLVQRFWWPNMLDDVKKYVETCQVCQRDKPRTRAPLGLLKPLPIPAGPGQSISMDFMDTLVTSKNGKRHIFVIVDRFTKYARLIAMPETARTEHVIKLFMDNWMNRVVQHLLRHYIKPSQDDWDEKLPLITSLYNNAVHSTIGVSPNQLHLGWKPRSALDFLLPENRTAANPGTIEFGVQYEKLLQQSVEHIKKSQEIMIASENKRRRQSTFQVGERVWVKASELGQEFGISRKLMPQYFGPWEVLDIVGNDLDGPSYVIRIPGHLRTYPVFHASKLAPFAETAQFPSRRSMLPPTMDGHVDVDDILDHRDTPVPKPPGRGRPPKPAREYRGIKEDLTSTVKGELKINQIEEEMEMAMRRGIRSPNKRDEGDYAYLCSRSRGACQAWLDNMLSTHNVAVSELHTKISWADLKAAWHKRFQVERPELQAAEKLQRFYQNDLPSTDWITEYQRWASAPNLSSTFVAIKHFFIRTSCPALQNALTQVAEMLTTSEQLFDKASQIIVTNGEAKNLGHSSAAGQGCLLGPQCATLCAHLHTYLVFYAPPSSPTDDEAAVGDILVYVTKVACEFRMQRYDDNNEPLLYVRIQVGQASCSALLDSGATRNFISQSFIQRAGLSAQVRGKPNPTAIKLADGRTQQLLDRQIPAVPVYFAPRACEPVTFDVLDTDFGIILGMPWLASADHTVNFHHRTLTVRDVFGTEVPCTIPLSHSSIRCQVVTAKSFRATCAYERTDEIDLCFLRAAATTESSPTDLSSDPRVVRLLDEFTNIFESPTGVVPERPISHEIILEAGAVPPKGCIYRMSEEELEVLRAQLDDRLDKGWIRPSSSPYGAPVLFVRKKNKDLRLSIDYRKLNAQTVKNAGPLPRLTTFSSVWAAQNSSQSWT